MSINTDGLTKRYGDITALEDLNLKVEPGQIYGFLGPNGAGKSTTINLLLGFTSPTAGSATVFGLDAETESVEIRRRTGVLPDGYDLYDRLTAKRHVEFAVTCKNADDDPMAILERVGLEADAHRKVGDFSKGMRQRLMFGQALIGDPDLLILDEPTSGLDPQAIQDVREIVFEERDRGATVFFSSHILSQVETTCDAVGIVNEGRLVAQDSIDNLKQTVDTNPSVTVTLSRDSVTLDRDRIANVEGVTDVRIQGTQIVVGFNDKSAKTRIIAEIESQADVADVTFEEPSMEQLFDKYTTAEASS